MKRIAAIVVTFNRKNLLLQNIAALLKQTEIQQLDILIIDNASKDGTYDAVKGLLSENVLYFNTGENIGGAGGFNFGMKKAMESGYDYFWLMDDDTIPTNDSLERLLDADRSLQGKYGFLCSRVLWKDETPCIMNQQKYKNQKIDQVNLQRELTEITQASFVSLFTTRKIVETVGLPIKEFFIWGDDVEYTRRISIRHKFPAYIVKSSVVHHLMNVNRGSNIAIDVVERIPRYRYAYRNEFYTYRQEGISGLLYYFLKCAYNFLRILIASKDNKVKRISVLIKSINEGCSFSPQIEYFK